ncbi:hypothetical protein H112_00734 [Trichophyton rubrum D6]|uniref:Uncharacterized protein n=3 Tax=Trichophyton rubrum TaxID=5551 RepID=A0A178F4E5_TRIRU|nr:uncharacterized protein TERG_08959 [Trichophyton rubrum CBS 118892]EZF27221.1 hypothetical protein H100_00733 [Trichophyton rubrum MR850]EZF46227.1 hypothetical protein H102_00723 [Trichophyton rubrum CBS 100081]EZF56994.1 hypothetical protein H103_00729 [Trichophyton rubrum CBS 288.86]EZF88750.1 hypothetical protein H110_00733 [Trichophyton rubrum MR1448]EZF99620.1 hypothetical protein H113_00732 [Trichophyton rubrum MR1459]KDB37969.1 hypothetical protein H112_00734 [Trichophyton rubrum D
MSIFGVLSSAPVPVEVKSTSQEDPRVKTKKESSPDLQPSRAYGLPSTSTAWASQQQQQQQQYRADVVQQEEPEVRSNERYEDGQKEALSPGKKEKQSQARKKKLKQQQQQQQKQKQKKKKKKKKKKLRGDPRGEI